MGEATGRIVFINSHDYVSDLLTSDDGSNGSLRLQQTLEIADASKARVAVDYFEVEASLPEQQRLVSAVTDRELSSGFLGPFNLKVMWTSRVK
jgi:hypothetical protein